MNISHITTHRLMPAAAIALCAAGILAGSVSAASTSSLTKTQRQQNREARYEQWLGKAVTNGKLTSAQEQTVLAEHNLLKGQLQAATAGNRKQVRAQVKQEATTWAQQNSIAARFLRMPPRRHPAHKAKR